jgi:hypothetical protein
MKTTLQANDIHARCDLLPAPTPCLWGGCPLMLWHLGPHQPPNGVCGTEPRVEAREGGRLRYWNVKDNDRKAHVGRVARGQHAEVLPRSWIRLFGIDDGKAFDRVFSVGDEAAYGGYNLTHTGQIVAIGLKTVSVRDEREAKRLSIYDFLFWNRRFDAQRTRAANIEVMHRI